MKSYILLLSFIITLSANAYGQTTPKKQTTGTGNKSGTTTTPAKTNTAPAKAPTTNTVENTGQVKSAPATTTPAKSTTPDKPAEPAKQRPFAKGDNIFNVGTGFGHFYGIFSGIVGYPSVNLSYENVFYDFENGTGAIGLGAVGGWWNGRYTDNYWFGYSNDYRATYNRFAIGARGVVHYDLFDSPQWDTYAGLNVGLYVSTSYVRYTDYSLPGNEYNSRSTSIYPMYGFFFGTRYYTGKSGKFGVFGELGYGLSVLRLGITLNL
jgi:hypothetical protein